MDYFRKAILISIFMFLTAECTANEAVIFEKEKEIKLNQNYQVTTCKNIGLAECPNCLDMQKYYFNIETKQLISSCGGACWHPNAEQKEICKSLCPPPKWKCKNDS
jgi:hypothetical protein